VGLWAIPLLWLALAGGDAAFTVAIDPGHGGTNLGAATLRPGLYEKHVTLEIARRVRRKLAAVRGLRVVLCRDGDVFQPIRTRVRCANEAGARLFISVHANASAEVTRGAQRGFELYVLPPADVDQDAAVAAATAGSDADAAWMAHRTRATAVESLAAARRIEWQLSDALGTDRDRGVKQGGAPLDTLQGVHMPAVLIEVGFLDHADEGKQLVSEAGWDAIAGALAKAISDLRARELRGRADPATTASRARARVEGGKAQPSATQTREERP
jgi:N-acetylmuramoyl-L-alanine amidase